MSESSECYIIIGDKHFLTLSMKQFTPVMTSRFSAKVLYKNIVKEVIFVSTYSVPRTGRNCMIPVECAVMRLSRCPRYFAEEMHNYCEIALKSRTHANLAERKY